MTSPTVSERVAQALVPHISDIFGVMGNGNAYFLDAAERLGLTFTAVRHEGAAVAAADAYYRTSGRLAAATTTYGAGYTNSLTGLIEAVRAQIPAVLITGDIPTGGPRPWDIDQPAVAEAVGAPTFTVTRSAAASITRQAIEHAIEHRTAVVLAIPYDLAAEPAEDEQVDASPLPARTKPPLVHELLEMAAELLASARRPLILAGRGAHLAGAGPALRVLAATTGALTAGTVLGQGIFAHEGDLGVAGGFSSEVSAELMAEADVVLAVGARLNQFTMRFGDLVGETATLIQIDTAPEPTSPRVDHFIHADARDAVEILTRLVPEEAPPTTWRTQSAPRTARASDRAQGEELAEDGRLDPRSTARALNALLPAHRVVVQDGGHFSGWVPMYWDIQRPQDLAMVGTAYQTIGLGLASLAGASAAAAPGRTAVLTTGDGGLLMGLADLETVARTATSAVIVVFNDGAYGAEIHQYASQGLSRAPMLIPDVDFASLARAVGATGTTVTRLEDLEGLREWIALGARGLHLVDCRISPAVRAPYMDEVLAAASKARERDASASRR
ncbi:thiamine pyrophosphate-binding protein [Sinomonas atrocyanea]|jgi:thiamine pyrophosphate-dependent acetolactate synthase large subunit-like protein|uniref:thiamine pyrophosphate-binding protein n=1 Tax=Sinomonas atrocyanea TaxID=37927 RepID=UPI002787BCF3|nr:thiamine pyrophosphate-binding protein [Sinomonas atrocyanea]MDQ0261119.1 thiamine pyrophosphate-dependent acetolactate synthase large subunit-like protein [Sinomonas atrocyanea]MDR6620447.1 thiamine pyrophosphate-dependent acetolactate synthase large subunit-like protein [Sinomonas atrocyanea]